MKSHLFLPAVLVALLALSACGGKKNQSAAPGTDEGLVGGTELKLDSITYTDSLGWYDDTLKCNTCYRVKLGIYYPLSGPRPLTDSIRAYLATYFSAPYPQGVLAREHAQMAVDTLGVHAMDGGKNGSYGPMGGAFSYSFVPVTINPDFVSFEVDTYFYGGGAHGLASYAGATFLAKNGHLLTKNEIFPAESDSLLLPIVEKAVCTQYYDKPDWKAVWAPQEPGSDFVLPQAAPAFSEKGLIFFYQPYEIGFYAMGSPRATVPYSEIEKLMTPEARALAASVSKK